MASTVSKGKNEFKQPGSADMENVKNEAMDKAKDVGHQAMDKAKDMTSQAKEMGGQVMDRAREAVGSVADMASNAASAVGKRAETLASTAGHQVHDAASMLREHLPHEGMAGRASTAVADALEGSAHYLEDMKLDNVAKDISNVVRSHPIPTILICLGIGFCVGRAMRD